MISKWLLCGPAVVLALGLVSCKKADSAPGPSYRISRPHWQNGEQTEAFVDVNDKVKALVVTSRKLGDSLVFEDSVPAVIAKSVCVDDKKNLTTNTTVFSNVSQIQIISILPPDILVPEALADANKVRCSYRFEARNESGAAHRFTMSETPVIDDSEKVYQITWMEKFGARRFETKDLQGFSVYTSTNEKITPALRCQTDKNLKYSGDDRSEFPLSVFPWPKDLKATVWQKCRVVGMKNGVVKMISRPFDVGFVVPPDVSKIPFCPDDPNRGALTHFGPRGTVTDRLGYKCRET